MRAVLTLGLLAAGICARPAPAQTPSWLERQPRQEGYLTGVGVARKTGDLAESRQRAFNAALHELAAQLQTALRADVRVEDRERAGRLEQEYQAQVRTEVAITLEGVELVDTWENAEHCWAYARLSEERMARRRQQRTDAARDAALAIFRRAEEARPVDVARALDLYLQALAPLRQAPGDPPEAVYQGHSVSLALEIRWRAQDVLSAISLEAAPVATPLRAGDRLDLPLIASARTARGAPIAGLPIAFRFVQGTGELDAAARTAADGRAISRLRRTGWSGTAFVVEARVDLPEAGRPFAVPSARFVLPVRQPLVFVRCAEPVALLGPALREELEQNGLRLADQPDQADLLLDLSGRVRPGQQVDQLCFSYVDLVLAVGDRSSGQEVYTACLTGVKGAGPTCEQAAFRAAASAAIELRQTILPAAFGLREQ